MLISAGLVIIKDNKIGLVKPKGLGNGQFSIPKGLINKNESSLNAAIRETKEETGLIIPKDLINSTPHVLNYISQKGLITKRIYYFVVNIDNEVIEKHFEIDETEVDDFQFYDVREAERVIYWKQLSVLNHIFPNRFNQKELQILESLNIIKRIKHPVYPIFLYNYTNKCKQFQFWNNTTLWCRGLVLDINGYVIARPFKKFFELHQLYDGIISTESNFKIVEKLDGALGILFFYKQKPILCTRQSFKSSQALKASEILYKKHSKEIYSISKSSTYLFEIIYPNTRFITNYGETADVFLLGAIDNKSGNNLQIVKGFSTPIELNELSIDSKKTEGAILTYADGFKVKVKYDFYKKLYDDVSELKKLIPKNKTFIYNDPEFNSQIKVDFINSYKMFNQRYLNLYLKVYRENKSLNESEICQIISKKNVCNYSAIFKKS